MRGSKGSYSSCGFLWFLVFFFWTLLVDEELGGLVGILRVVVEVPLGAEEGGAKGAEEGEVRGEERREEDKNSEGSATGRPLMEMLGATRVKVFVMYYFPL